MELDTLFIKSPIVWYLDFWKAEFSYYGRPEYKVTK